VSTFTDGAPPSVSPDPGDDPGSANGREPAPMNGDQDDWLQEEIRRRMAARAAEGGGSRHARRGAPSPFPGTGQVAGHRPRHATPPGSPAPPPAGGPQAPLPASQRPLPSRARRFDAPRPGPSTNDPTTIPPASRPPSPTPTPGPALGGPAVLHPAFGGQAPPESVYGGLRRGPAFADPALLGDPPARNPAAGPPLTPVPDRPGPPAPDAPPRPTPGRRNRPADPPGFVLPPSVAFRDGAAAGRAFAGIPGVASPSPVPSRTDETGPVPAVEPAALDDTGGANTPKVAPTGPNGVGNLRRMDAPAAAPATPIGPGLPELAGNPVRTGRRPVPPAGPAAARLLSPPPSPPSTPTGIPIEGETDPTQAGTESSTAPAPGTGRQVAVPAQRGASDAPAEPGTVTTDLETSEAPRRYVDYDDYDDDYEDPELDAEIAEAARREAEAAAEDAPETIKRVRVVLAERKMVARPVRTVDVVRDGTGVGEVLRRGLIRSQLTVALSFAAVALLALGVLPLAFAYLPELTRASVLGIRLPWLLLGGLVYPFLLGLGWWHARAAERVEKGFADHVQG
jgi:hypothetical protein